MTLDKLSQLATGDNSSETKRQRRDFRQYGIQNMFVSQNVFTIGSERRVRKIADDRAETADRLEPDLFAGNAARTGRSGGIFSFDEPVCVQIHRLPFSSFRPPSTLSIVSTDPSR